VSDQVQGAGYSKSEVEMDADGLKLEMETTSSSQVVSREVSNQEQYAAD
jgi:hypothetical protein